jgi:hypothetical protein
MASIRIASFSICFEKVVPIDMYKLTKALIFQRTFRMKTKTKTQPTFTQFAHGSRMDILELKAVTKDLYKSLTSC